MSADESDDFLAIAALIFVELAAQADDRLLEADRSLIRTAWHIEDSGSA